ncbi:MAG: hypothetical protein AAF493_27580 [Pseudomonadota bacterium]
MKLRSLTVDALPGIRGGFTIDGLDDHINIILGPNASGKTSLCRAFRYLLYPEERTADFVNLEAHVAIANKDYTIARTGSDIRWRNGVEARAPHLPDHRFVRCYTLTVDDFFIAGATESEIRQHILRELAGGFDLDAVRDAPTFRRRLNAARKPASDLRDSGRALREAERDYRALDAEQSKLSGLRELLAQATAAGERITKLSAVLAVRLCAKRLDDLNQSLAAYPDDLGALRGDELTRYERLAQQAHELDRRLATARHTQEAAVLRLEADEATGWLPDEDAIALSRRRLERLRELEHRAKSCTERKRTASDQLAHCNAVLGTRSPFTQTPIGLADIDAMESLVESLQMARTELTAAQAALDHSRENARAERRLHASHMAREALASWLHEAQSTPAGWPTWLAVALTVVGAISLGYWASVSDNGFAWLGLLMLAMPMAIVGQWHNRETRQRSYREQWSRHGLSGPRAWGLSEVRARLSTLENDIADLEVAVREHQRHLDQRRTVASADERYRSLTAEVKNRAIDLGIDANPFDASFSRWLRTVYEHDSALESQQAIDREIESIERERSAIQSKLAELLSEHVPLTSPPDADAMSALIERLASALRRREVNRQTVDSAQSDVQQLSEQRALIAQEIVSLFDAVGLSHLSSDNQLAELRRRLSMREPWDRAQRALVEAREAARIAAAPIENDEAFAQMGADFDPAPVESEIDELARRADTRDDLLREITRIEKGVADAAAGDQLETRRAARDRAYIALQSEFEQAIYAEAGQLLLDDVVEDYEARARPQILLQAEEWFRRFTRNEFNLRFRHDAPDGFTAVDTATNQVRTLAELSSGTRMQLLLAVRLAFALEAERGATPLPLFLDEVLTTSDPNRYREVLHALKVLALEGDRQVFYLTAQPGDLYYWKDVCGDLPHVVDLADVRRLATTIAVPEQLSFTPTQLFPDPGALSPEAYAQAIGVDWISPWAPASVVHPFHLLPDDLTTLATLLNAGATTVGGLQSLLGSGAGAVLLDTATVSLLEARIDLLQAYLDASRRGHGRPLDRAALEEAPVSPTFRAPIVDLSERLQGDAAGVLAAIDAGEVPRFQRRGAPRQRLHDWLVDEGYIDERPAFDRLALGHHVIAKLGHWLEKDVLSAADVRALVQRLYQASPSLHSLVH